MTPSELQALRKKKKLSRADLASLIGTSEQSVYRWESGKHPINKRTEQAVRWALDARVTVETKR